MATRRVHMNLEKATEDVGVWVSAVLGATVCLWGKRVFDLIR